MFSSNIVDHDLLFEDANMCVFFVIYYEVYVVNCNVELLLCTKPGNSECLVSWDISVKDSKKIEMLFYYIIYDEDYIF